MDMRDPWSLSKRVHESLATPLWLRIAERSERLAVRRAALVVANTQAACEALAAAYPDAARRLITVMNGSDDEPLPPSRHSHRFTLAYAGTIYHEDHPRHLFRAAATLIRELGLAPVDFGINFIGGDLPAQCAIVATAREEGITEFVSVGQTRPHQEALSFLAGATMLVAFPGWDPSTIPAKIFEYVRFDAWLLVLSEKESATERLAQGTEADVVAADDVSAIAAVIRRRYHQYRRGMQPVRAVVDDRFSRAKQARILLDAIGKLAGVEGPSSGP
jgi:hypothetical protein